MTDNGAAQTTIAKKNPPKKQKRGRKRKSDEFEAYVVRLERFEPSYSFRLNQDRYQERDGVYSEYVYSKIHGKLISPEIKGVTAVEVTIMTDRALDRERFPKSPDYSPASVGGAKLGDRILYIYLFVPFQALCMLMPAFVAGQIEVLVANGMKLKYRETRITGMRFEAKFHPEDYSQ
jgi:hypothetical protein